MIKPSKVVFVSDDLQKAFDELPKDDFLRKAISRAVIDLNDNAFCGIQIPKRLFPAEYIKKYRITNLWKYDLPKGWRLIYTVTAYNEVDLISAILEWFPHKTYEKRFKF